MTYGIVHSPSAPDSGMGANLLAESILDPLHAHPDREAA